MVSHVQIEQPTVLAALTPPIDKESGRTFASSVSTLQGLNKRKRTEVAVAADGATIDIYNVQSSSLITSHSFPPQSSFLTSPVSILRKAPKEKTSQRFTYACVRPDAGSSIQRLSGFAANVTKTASATPASYSVDLSSSAASPVLLDIFPTINQDGVEDHTVLLVRADGSFYGFSSTLDSSSWENSDISQLDSPEHAERKVLHASLVDSARARRGLLKNREDLVARFENDPHADGFQILSLLVSTPTDVQLHLFALRPQFATAGSVTVPPAIYLDHIKLPLGIEYSTLGKLCWTIDAVSGKLFAQTQKEVTTIDLTALVPKLSSEFSLSDSSVGSSIYLGANVMGFSTPSVNFVCDLHYASVLGSGFNDESAILSTISRKRKRADDEDPVKRSLEFVAYFSKLQSAVGIWHGQLISLPLSALNLNLTGRSEPLLIDSLGKGVPRPLQFKGLPHLEGVKTVDWCFVDSTNDSEWSKTKVSLDRFAKAKDVESFEDLFRKSIGMVEIGGIDKIKEVKPASESQDADEVEKLKSMSIKKPSKGRKTARKGIEKKRRRLRGGCMYLGPSLWETPANKKGEAARAYPEIAAYAISRMFRWSNSKDSQYPLSLRFLPHNVFRWLCQSGHLTLSSLQSALQPRGEIQVRQIQASDFISAIVRRDRTMRLFHDFVMLQSNLDVASLMQVVKNIIQCLDTDHKEVDVEERPTDASSDSRQKPSSGAVSVDVATDVSTTGAGADTDPENALVSTSESEVSDRAVKAVTRDLAFAITTLKYGAFIRGQSLRRALTQLHTFPLSTVTAQMRSSLTTHEIIFLIQLLRIELADGGWTSRYFGDVKTGRKRGSSRASRASASDEAVTLISDLVTCAVDAIGLSGWLNEAVVKAEGDEEGQGGESEAESLLLSLQNEITLTLEGLHETTFIIGMLDGFFKHSSEIYSNIRAQRSQNKNKRRDVPPPRTCLMSIDDPILAWNEKMEESGLLPLGGGTDEFTGLRLDQSGRVKSGGRRKMTSRYRANEISKRVGMYSRELIRF